MKDESAVLLEVYGMWIAAMNWHHLTPYTIEHIVTLCPSFKAAQDAAFHLNAAARVNRRQLQQLTERQT